VGREFNMRRAPSCVNRKIRGNEKIRSRVLLLVVLGAILNIFEYYLVKSLPGDRKKYFIIILFSFIGYEKTEKLTYFINIIKSSYNYLLSLSYLLILGTTGSLLNSHY
jgi:hypothetical protein